MKLIGIRDFRNRSARIWKDLREEKELIITSNGKPVGILSDVSEEDLEERLAALRRARAVSAVTALQRESVRQGTDKLTPEDIDTEIRAVRKKRS